METHAYAPTCPFGPRGLSEAVLRTHRAVRACPAGQPVHKWKVFRLVCEAKDRLGVSDRSLAVLEALVSFHPDTALVAGDTDLVVFPSNRHLALRAHGIAPSTLRRHLAVLVEAGLVLRRDSPNGKRYARKGGEGEIDHAFGFDLGPLVARVEEFAALAEAVRMQRRALILARERVTLLRRDIVKSIAAGMTMQVPADWPGFHATLASLLTRLGRRDDRSELAAVASDLQRLAAEILKLLEAHIELGETSTRESHPEHHIQNSKPETLSESEPDFRESRGRSIEPGDEAKRTLPVTFSLELVMKACPDLADYARHGIGTWRDLLGTVALVRPMLGISPDAWQQACTVLGEQQASVIIACILQRSDAIRAPGGYLRDLTRRAKDGAFSIGPMLMALIAAHPPARPVSGSRLQLRQSSVGSSAIQPSSSEDKGLK